MLYRKYCNRHTDNELYIFQLLQLEQNAVEKFTYRGIFAGSNIDIFIICKNLSQNDVYFKGCYYSQLDWITQKQHQKKKKKEESIHDLCGFPVGNVF